MSRRPPRAASHPAVPDLRRTCTSQRMELLLLWFGATAHELGNLASPLGLIASTLGAVRPAADRAEDADAASAADARTAALAGSLHRVGAGMHDLATAARHIRGLGAGDAFAPPAHRDLARWWASVAPLMHDVLPCAAVIDGQVSAGIVPATTLTTLTWLVPALVRATGLQHPDARRVTLRLQHDGSASVVAGSVTAAPCLPDRALRRAARRWIALADAELARAGGTCAAVSSGDTFAWEFLVPVVPDAAGQAP
ncbi:MAG: hypothetical protein IT355_02675 [Gemmatimonadaceae bacterium]|nr:hypothetical protein [Gemmatimonadaceae bacterium]